MDISTHGVGGGGRWRVGKGEGEVVRVPGSGRGPDMHMLTFTYHECLGQRHRETEWVTSAQGGANSQREEPSSWEHFTWEWTLALIHDRVTKTTLIRYLSLKDTSGGTPTFVSPFHWDSHRYSLFKTDHHPASETAMTHLPNRSQRSMFCHSSLSNWANQYFSFLWGVALSGHLKSYLNPLQNNFYTCRQHTSPAAFSSITTPFLGHLLSFPPWIHRDD